MSAILIFFLVLNFAVSWFNAWSVGRGWAESKAVGGLARFMEWCGATMSACGFTWCYLVLIFIINSFIPEGHRLPAKYSEIVFRLGYLAIIFPIIGSGIAITIQSWAYFWKERTFVNGAVAGYNTFADVYNIYTSFRAIPQSFSFVENIFSSDDDEDDGLGAKLKAIVIALVVLCVAGGILTTVTIIRSTARKVSVDQSDRIPVQDRVSPSHPWPRR